MQAHGYERVLQRRARTRVRVYVAGRHAPQVKPLGQPFEPPVACAIIAQERTLELDPEVLGPKTFSQPPNRGLVVHSTQRASAQADQAFGVVENGLKRRRGVRRRSAFSSFARVRVRARQDLTEIGPAPLVLHEQPQVAPIVQIDFRPVDGAKSQCVRGDREFHRARDRVVVCQG